MAVRRLGPWRRFAWALVKPPMLVLTRRQRTGMEHLPADGGLILVCNHVSEFDPLVIAHYVYDAGRWPRFLAKASLFHKPLLGGFLHRAGQIPVYRGTADAVKSLRAAIDAVRAGHAVIIYPEGTTTKDPDLWPGRGKTGVARLFLETGAPVVPLVSWGPQRMIDPRGGRIHPQLRVPVTVVAGPPVDLSRWAGVEATTASLNEITELLMARLREMLGQIRGEPVPAGPALEPDPEAAPVSGPDPAPEPDPAADPAGGRDTAGREATR